MSDDGPLIDLASLEAIAGLKDAGGEHLLKNVVALYLSHSPVLLRKLDEAVAKGDSDAIMEVAHTLKSSCAQLGAHRLATALKEMELLGRLQETGATPEVLRAVHRGYGAARSVLETYLSARFPR